MNPFAIAALAIQIGSTIVGAVSQNKAAKANKAEALKALMDSWKDISLQEVQQQDATQLTIMQADRQARKQDALARVSAGESGVAGASVDALLDDISQEASQFRQTQKRNLAMTIAQLQREKVSGRTIAQSRINAVQSANPFAVGLQIGGAAADFLSTHIKQKPSGGSSN